MDIASTAALLIIAAIVIAGVRIVAENERFVVSMGGRFLKLTGPGLVYRMPGLPQQWTKIKLGDIGIYRGGGLGEFHGVAVPVAESSAQTNDAVQITSFRDGKVWVSKAAERVVVCEKCGHENRVSA